MPQIQSGPGALSILGAIPNFLILVGCAISGFTCWFTRPRVGELSALIFLSTLAAFCLGVSFLWTHSQWWGGYDLRVCVLDTKRHPIGGIKVSVMKQKAGLGFISALLQDDVISEANTDLEGCVVIKANRLQHVGGLVNMSFIARGGNGTRLNPAYRFADFNVMPADNGETTVCVSWSKFGELDNSNMHRENIKPFETAKAALIVILPAVAAEKSDIY